MLGPRALIRYAAVAIIMDMAVGADFSILPIKNTKTSQSTPSPVFVPITSGQSTTMPGPQLPKWNTTIFTAITPSRASGAVTLTSDAMSFVFPTDTSRIRCPPSPVWTITATNTYNIGNTVVPWVFQQANGTNVTSYSTISPSPAPSATVVCGPDQPCTTPEREFWCMGASYTTKPLTALYLVTSAWTEPARFVPTSDNVVGGLTVVETDAAQPKPMQPNPPPATFAPEPTAPPASPPQQPQVTRAPLGVPRPPSPPQVISNNPLGPISANPSGPGVILPGGSGGSGSGAGADAAPPAVLQPGAVTTINNIPVSLDAQGTQLQIGTLTFAAPQSNPNPTPPPIPLAVLPSSAGILLPNGQTLAPGSSTVLDGSTSIYLPPTGPSQATPAAVVVVNGGSNTNPTIPNNNNQQQQQQPSTQTIPLSSLPTGTSLPLILSGGHTLLPGVTTTISGIPVYLLPGATAVVVGSSTIPLTPGTTAPTGISGSSNSAAAAAVSAIASEISAAASSSFSASASAAAKVTAAVHAASVTAAPDASTPGVKTDYSMSFRSRASLAPAEPSAKAGGGGSASNAAARNVGCGGLLLVVGVGLAGVLA